MCRHAGNRQSAQAIVPRLGAPLPATRLEQRVVIRYLARRDTLFLCNAVLGIIARSNHQSGDRFDRHWPVLCLVVLGLLIDEQAKIHDLGSGFGTEMRERLELGGVLYYGWVIIVTVTLALLAVAYWRFVVALSVHIRALLLVAGGFYLGGEMGMEMVGGWIMDRYGETFFYHLATAFEEFLAMVGVLIAIGTLLAYARTAIGTVSLGDRRDCTGSCRPRGARQSSPSSSAGATASRPAGACSNAVMTTGRPSRL